MLGTYIPPPQSPSKYPTPPYTPYNTSSYQNPTYNSSVFPQYVPPPSPKDDMAS